MIDLAKNAIEAANASARKVHLIEEDQFHENLTHNLVRLNAATDLHLFLLATDGLPPLVAGADLSRLSENCPPPLAAARFPLESDPQIQESAPSHRHGDDDDLPPFPCRQFAGDLFQDAVHLHLEGNDLLRLEGRNDPYLLEETENFQDRRAWTATVQIRLCLLNAKSENNKHRWRRDPRQEQ